MSFSQLTQSTDRHSLQQSFNELSLSSNNLIYNNSNDSNIPLLNQQQQQQQQQHKSSYYCLLVKEYSASSNDTTLSNTNTSTDTTTTKENDSQQQQQDNFQQPNRNSYTLNIVLSNADELQQLNIKSFILTKSSKNMIYKTGSIGQIEDSNNPSTSGSKTIISCYYTLMEVEQQPLTYTTTTTPKSKSSKQQSLTLPSSSTTNIKRNVSSSLLLDLEDLEDVMNESLETSNSDSFEGITNDGEKSMNSSLGQLNMDSILEDIEDLDFGTFKDSTTSNINLDDQAEKEGEGEEEEFDIQSSTTKEYYLCLCYEHLETEANRIEPYHLELGDFCKDIGNMIKVDNSNIHLNHELKSMLSNWYSNCINYIPRIIDLLNDKLPLVLHATLSGYSFDVHMPKPECKDFIGFIRSLSISNHSSTLISQPQLVSLDDNENNNNNNSNNYHYQLQTNNNNNNNNPLDFIKQQDIIPITVNSNNQLVFNYNSNNIYCKKWSKKFYDNKFDSLLLRNIIEDIKLKMIQELNLFRRMVDSSKLNNYLLYKCYLFLLSNDNSDIMLRHLTRDNPEQSIKELLLILGDQLNIK